MRPLRTPIPLCILFAVLSTALFAQPNDNCASATPLTLGVACTPIQYTSIGSTSEALTVAPAPTCGSYSGGDVWFSFTVPASGNFRIDMTSAGNLAKWALYSGSCGAFTQMRCATATDDLASNFNDAALAGQTLYLRSWRSNSASGVAFDLCVHEITSPSNDACANAIPLAVGTSCTFASYSSEFSTAEATSVAPNPTCGFYSGGDVWFTFVAPLSGNFRVDMTSAGNGAKWALYSGNCGAFTQVRCASSNDDLASNFNDPTLAGQTLYLRSWEFNSQQGIAFDVCIHEITSPSNDACANAIPLAVGTSCTFASYSSEFSTAEATSVAPNPTCGFYAGGDVWFTFVVPASGNFRIAMTSVGSNASWALYSGTCGSFSQIRCASNNDATGTNFTLPTLSGQTLYLRSWDFNSQQGIAFDVCIHEITPPINNNCANAIVLVLNDSCSATTYSSQLSTEEGTSIAANPSCGFYAGGDVWFTFEAPATGQFAIEMVDLLGNNAFSVLTGACGNFQEIACSSANTINFNDPLLGGQTLTLRAYRVNSSQGGDFDLCVVNTTVAPNDNCVDAIVLPVNSTCSFQLFDNFNTTLENGIAPAPSCIGPIGGDVWFSFTVPATGALRVERNNISGGNFQFAVYSGGCGSFLEVACSSGASQLLINDPLLAGSTLYLRVWRLGSLFGGEFELCVQAGDCNGVIGGTDLPGAPCDDGNNCTTGDVIDTNCNCSGVFQDSDNDGTCDANDVCPNGPEPGTLCDDGNPGTINDVVDSNCLCVGTPLISDCNGVPGGPAIPGTPCDDLDACTTGDLFDANCNCAGVFQDADNDGTCDANDVCPNGPEPGAPCDDLSACTTGDVIDANCNCTGTPVDPDDNDPCTVDTCDPILGVINTFVDSDNDGTCDANDVCPNGPEPGTPCDDLSACTTGDVIDANCNCVGTPVDPDDNDPCTVDTCDPILGVINTFVDSDNDGTCDANDVCPNGPEPGQSCDDGNAGTTNDTVDATCVCMGTPVGSCTGTEVELLITTDANGADVTWAIIDDMLITVASGGPYPTQNNTTISEIICLPTNLSSCFGLYLYDSMGDGICCSFGNGSWLLRNMNGQTIIQDNGVYGTQSPSTAPASAGYVNGHEFCLPLGPSAPVAAGCEVFTNSPITKIYTTAVAGATAYQFEFSDPNAGFRRRMAVYGRNWVRISEMNTVPLVPGTTYFMRARVDQGGAGFSDDHFGPGCQMAMDNSVVAGCTELIDDTALPTHSCNTVKTFGAGDKLYALPVYGATQYRFRFTNAGEGFTRVITRPNYICLLNWLTLPLQDGVTYTVDVESFYNGAWSGFCGASCTVSIGAPAINAARLEGSADANASLTLFPNPTREQVVYLHMDGLTDAETRMSIDVYDAFGKRVFAEQHTQSGAEFNYAMDLGSDLPAGMYLVNVTIGETLYTQRLVRQ